MFGCERLQQGKEEIKATCKMKSIKSTIASRFLQEDNIFKTSFSKGLQGRIVNIGKKAKAKKVQIGLDGDDFLRDRKSIYFFS